MRHPSQSISIPEAASPILIPAAGDRKTATTSLIARRTSPTAWDQLCAQFDDALPEQTGVFNMARWGADKVETLVFERGGSPVGGAVAIVRSIPFNSTGIAIVKWGPLTRRFGEPFSPTQFADAIACLVAHFCEERSLNLTLLPAVDPAISGQIRTILDEAGFTEGDSLSAANRYLVKTDVGAADLRASLDQKWRYNLKRAQKNSFDIEFVDDDQGLEEFMRLYREMHERKRFRDTSTIDALPTMMATSCPDIRPKIALVRHDGRVTAGGVFSLYGDRATYMFGATDERALKLRAGYALHWWVAEHCIGNPRLRWYDLGGDEANSGLQQFKKGLVGKIGRVVEAPPMYHYCKSATVGHIARALLWVRKTKSTTAKLLHQLKN